IIAGLIPATDSTPVLINSEPINPQRHNISFVFQETSCLPWRNVRDNIKFGLEIKKAVLNKGISENEIKEKVKRIINLVGLDEFKEYYPHQISGGMKQRVSIAQAFVTDPDLLLMDEPFGYLDVQTRYYMEKEVLRIWEKLKRTVIFVTHNIEEAVYLAERIVVLTELPAHVKAVISIDLPRPRDYADPEFVKIRRHITNLVKWW
ncbi:MAG: ATP-binding cassette domain-containing protein, partial [Candidatus Korarchaeota archaeon]|nr:ATP-binding cassette domain-containing protein [Candidatus Thorarchaeota archaeon]NIW50846.1 ATP-binding cassette domain-containing protein [Candidatus Korarchaeota archaeon]